MSCIRDEHRRPFFPPLSISSRTFPSLPLFSCFFKIIVKFNTSLIFKHDNAHIENDQVVDTQWEKILMLQYMALHGIVETCAMLFNYFSLSGEGQDLALIRGGAL